MATGAQSSVNNSGGSTRIVKSRAPIACKNCRSRKVRCDIAFSGPPCLNCKLDHIECAVAQCRRGRRSVIMNHTSYLGFDSNMSDTYYRVRREERSTTTAETTNHRNARTKHDEVSSSSTSTQDFTTGQDVADVDGAGDIHMPDILDNVTGGSTVQLIYTC